MPASTDAELVALRTVLRDLVALSAIPAAWVGREPAAVAGDLADTLTGLLRLDFMFVRLCVPGFAGAVDVMRGDAWKTFPEWLKSHLGERGGLTGREIVPNVDGGAHQCRGVVVPIGVDGEGGMVAAACDRPDFPSAFDLLLLNLATNHAAAAFQSVCLNEHLQLMFRDLRESERKLERSRAELAASRARIVTAADETRRRIERDLHDGVQQRLVSLLLAQRTAQGMVPPGLINLQEQLSELVDGLAEALEELQEISRGIHPAILADGGLARALKTLARRSAVPVDLAVRIEMRPPAPVEVAAYYVVSEALTNAAKHARASLVLVSVVVSGSVLELSISDDGAGGADFGRGSGLIGLADRVDALGGTIEVASPAGHGTTLHVTLPLQAG